jgi:SAM-dependent methyltransferase
MAATCATAEECLELVPLPDKSDDLVSLPSLRVCFWRPADPDSCDTHGSAAATTHAPEPRERSESLTSSSGSTSDYSEAESVKLALWAYAWGSCTLLAELFATPPQRLLSWSDEALEGSSEKLLLSWIAQGGDFLVVELGAGIGQLALCLRATCPAAPNVKILATDYVSDGVMLALHPPGATCGVLAARLDWCAVEEAKGLDEASAGAVREMTTSGAHLILGSDVMYAPESGEAILACVRWLRPGGSLVIADPGRQQFDLACDLLGLPSTHHESWHHVCDRGVWARMLQAPVAVSAAATPEVALPTLRILHVVRGDELSSAALRLGGALLGGMRAITTARRALDSASIAPTVFLRDAGSSSLLGGSLITAKRSPSPAHDDGS